MPNETINQATKIVAAYADNDVVDDCLQYDVDDIMFEQSCNRDVAEMVRKQLDYVAAHGEMAWAFKYG